MWDAWRLLRRRLVALQWVQRARVGVLSLSERVGADVSGDVPLCGGGVEMELEARDWRDRTAVAARIGVRATPAANGCCCCMSEIIP